MGRSEENGIIPDGWRMVCLGDVAEVAFSGVDKRTVAGELPVQLCNYTDVFYNRRIHQGMAFMTATATSAECDRWTLREGDVLFTKDSETADEIGIPSYVTEDMSKVLCGYHLGLARPKDGVADGAFLARALASRECGREFTRRANGITRFGLTLEAARSLPILLPTLREQQGIASVLDSIDDAIDGTEAVIAATEQLRDALLHELLTRGVPGWHTEWKESPGIGTMPADWKMVRLGDVAEVNARTWDPSEGNHIQYLDLTAVVIPGVLAPPRELEAKDAPSRARRCVESGDILVSTVRPNLRGFARVAAAPVNLIASTGFAVVTAKSRVDGSLLYHHVMTDEFANYLEECTTGQAYPAVRAVDVANFRFAVGPLPEQQTIATLLDSVEDATDRARRERDVLQTMKGSVADALLTGRMRVGSHF